MRLLPKTLPVLSLSNACRLAPLLLIGVCWLVASAAVSDAGIVTSFLPKVTHGTAAGPVEGVAADFNGDRADDLVTAHVFNDARVSVLLSDGSAGLHLRTDYKLPTGQAEYFDVFVAGKPPIGDRLKTAPPAMVPRLAGAFGRKAAASA